jgi:hypothetical protein
MKGSLIPRPGLDTGCLWIHDAPVVSVRVHADGRAVWSEDARGVIRFGTVVAGGAGTALQIGDGRGLSVAGAAWLVAVDGGELRFVHLHQGAVTRTWRGRGEVRSVALSSDGLDLGVVDDAGVTWMRAATGRVTAQLGDPSVAAVASAGQGAWWVFPAWSPNGDQPEATGDRAVWHRSALRWVPGAEPAEVLGGMAVAARRVAWRADAAWSIATTTFVDTPLLDLDVDGGGLVMLDSQGLWSEGSGGALEERGAWQVAAAHPRGEHWVVGDDDGAVRIVPRRVR